MDTSLLQHLQSPTVLTGCFFLLFFVLLRGVINARIFPKLSDRSAIKALLSSLRYGFLITLIVIVLAFALTFSAPPEVGRLSNHWGPFIGSMVVVLGFALSFFLIHRETLPSVGAETVHVLADFVKYPFPKVREADCYSPLLGVQKSEYVDRYKDKGQTPPYVPRNIDGQLTEALKRKDFVLVVGPTAAGKTRTTYEALLRVAPSRPMVLPLREEDLGQIVKELKARSDRPNRGRAMARRRRQVLG